MQITRVEDVVTEEREPGQNLTAEAKTLNGIHKQGIGALIKALGPVDAVRFLQFYDSGSGDYTKERKQWLETDPEKYLAAVLAYGKKKTRA
jgi:hypothetical protein